MVEVVTLEEQRLSDGLGKGVSETVAEVQPGRMSTAFAEIAVGLPRNLRLPFRNRLNQEPGFTEDEECNQL